MKPREFADALDTCGGLLPPSDDHRLRLFAKVFRSSSAASVANTVAILRKASIPITVGNPSIEHLLSAVAPLHAFIQIYGKPAIAKDFSTVVEFLSGHSRVGIELFVESAISALEKRTPPQPPVDEELVQHHLVQLEKALGDDAAFTAAYKALECDRDAGKLEIAAIAKRFTDTSPQSRPAALKTIWARRHSLMNLQR
jgi:hypothetical protein